jgi:transposase
MRPKPFGFHRPGTHQATPAAHLSAAILDSQSVKTTDRGPQLRRRQAASTPQAPPAGRHPRPGRQGPGDRRRRRRPQPLSGLATPAPGHRLPGHAAPRRRTQAALAAAGCHATDCRRSRWSCAVVVERTFAWLGRFRRLSKDYEIGRVSRLLWRSLKAASRSRAPIWRAAITVTQPIGAALVRLALEVREVNQPITRG